ncbi:hypothetical protein [Micromonospora sp. NPDC049282]|uniref:hypothetical protein n=1 Tax=Micromonospora sp. NPDC049282 TaxID=3364269 RepID=UPI003717B244
MAIIDVYRYYPVPMDYGALMCAVRKPWTFAIRRRHERDAGLRITPSRRRGSG